MKSKRRSTDQIRVLALDEIRHSDSSESIGISMLPFLFLPLGVTLIPCVVTRHVKGQGQGNSTKPDAFVALLKMNHRTGPSCGRSWTSLE